MNAREQYWKMRKELWDKHLRVGDQVMVSHGSYDDFTIMDLLTVIRDFHPQVEIELYLKQYPDQKVEFGANYGGFIDWLVQRLLVTRVEYKLMSLGDYGEFTINVKPTSRQVTEWYDRQK